MGKILKAFIENKLSFGGRLKSMCCQGRCQILPLGGATSGLKTKCSWINTTYNCPPLGPHHREEMLAKVTLLVASMR